MLVLSPTPNRPIPAHDFVVWHSSVLDFLILFPLPRSKSGEFLFSRSSLFLSLLLPIIMIISILFFSDGKVGGNGSGCGLRRQRRRRRRRRQRPFVGAASAAAAAASKKTLNRIVITAAAAAAAAASSVVVLWSDGGDGEGDWRCRDRRDPGGCGGGGWGGEENIDRRQVKIARIPNGTRKSYSAVLVLRMAYRRWRETKQLPSMLPGSAVPGCYLVSFHFLWAILSTSTVQ